MMTWPGVKRPPPMEPELVRETAALEAGREERCGGAATREGARRGVAGGAMVSPSAPTKLLSTRVASLPESTGLPQVGQYRLASGMSLEQETQRINSGDCITLAGMVQIGRVTWRTNSSAPSVAAVVTKDGHEMRSTCTAVP